jgi:hypothetical protein
MNLHKENSVAFRAVLLGLLILTLPNALAQSGVVKDARVTIELDGAPSFSVDLSFNDESTGTWKSPKLMIDPREGAIPILQKITGTTLDNEPFSAEREVLEDGKAILVKDSWGFELTSLPIVVFSRVLFAVEEIAEATFEPIDARTVAKPVRVEDLRANAKTIHLFSDRCRGFVLRLPSGKTLRCEFNEERHLMIVTRRMEFRVMAKDEGPPTVLTFSVEP